MGLIKQEYSCSLILSHDLIGGKWKLRILWHIIQHDNRFSLLKKAIPDITTKVLVTQLKDLEECGLITKKDFKTYPLHIEYTISDKYEDLIPVIDALCIFTKRYAEKNGIAIAD